MAFLWSMTSNSCLVNLPYRPPQKPPSNRAAGMTFGQVSSRFLCRNCCAKEQLLMEIWLCSSPARYPPAGGVVRTVSPTWRSIPPSKWLVTLASPQFLGLSHLQVGESAPGTHQLLSGMILPVRPEFFGMSSLPNKPCPQVQDPSTSV